MDRLCLKLELMLLFRSVPFSPIQIPAQLYDSTLKSVMVTDPDAIDQLLKRKCIEQG